MFPLAQLGKTSRAWSNGDGAGGVSWGGFSLPDPGRRGAAGPESPQGEPLGLFQHFPQPVASVLELELARS